LLFVNRFDGARLQAAPRGSAKSVRLQPLRDFVRKMSSSEDSKAVLYPSPSCELNLFAVKSQTNLLNGIDHQSPADRAAENVRYWLQSLRLRAF
jgi:hypothetical protein